MSSTVAFVGRAQRRYPLLQIVAVVLLFLYGIATLPSFASEPSVRSMLVLAALLGLASIGQTLCVLIGALDLSVPGIIVLGAAIVSKLVGEDGWPFLGALVVMVLVTGSIGAFTGWICHRYRIIPIIVTLATSAIALGAAQVWTNSAFTGVAPQFLTDLVSANGTTFGMPVSPIVIIWVALTIVIGVILYRTRAGRSIYGTGANPRAADLALVNTRWVWVSIFTVSAILSGLLGFLLAGFSGVNATLGDPYLFQSLTAVVIGGTIFMGARGDYTHTFVGALFLTVLTSILVGHGYNTADQQIIFGLLIIVVVAGYGRDRKLSDRL